MTIDECRRNLESEVRFTPPWENPTREEIEHGVLKSVKGKYAFVQYKGDDYVTKTHPANLVLLG